ncbi:PEGA domain-containing protein, partial [candidate division KSB1 bacterium]|nr:PEGA domain-containing protein [candidate division KSB1 bacterium]
SRLIDSKEAKEAVQQITKGELDTAKLEQQNVPLPIQKILQKMLQKDPDQRYFGASGVYLDLVEFLMANTFSVELSKELGDYIQGLYDNKVKPGQPAPVLAEPVIRDSKEPDSEPVLQEIIIKQPSSDVPPELDNQADEKKPQLVEKQQEQEKEKEGQELPISSTNSVENVAEINQNAEIEKILLEIENDFKQEINKKNGASTGETSGALEKNEKMEEPVSSEKVRRDQPATISQTFLDDDEVQDDLKTIFDVIRLSTKSHLKGIKIASVVLLSLLLLFLVFDFFQQFTPIGTALYERIYPPAIKIVTVPPGAAVYLDEKRIPGETPISIPEIASGVYQLFLTHEGFKPLKKSIHVPITGKIKISGETKPSDSLTFLFRFKAGINLNSNPSGATIYLNDVQYPQQTPVSFEWEAGAPLSIEMTHAGLNRISGLTLNSGGDEINIEDDRIWSYQAFDSPVKKIQIEAIFTKTFTLNIIPNDVVWFVDGSSVPAGTTSVSNTFSLPLGEHEILFKKQGFNDKLITLRADENTPEIVSLVLDRTVRFIAKQNASADSNEIDAKITRYVLRNKSYALNKVTPCDVTLPAVNVRVYIEKDGYKKANLVVPAEKRQVAFTLEISAVSVEISVFDALTDIPLENTSITYEITTGDLTEDVLFGITDYDGKCVNSLKSGEYNFKVKKDGYYEKQMVFNTLNTDEQKMEFKLIIQ